MRRSHWLRAALIAAAALAAAGCGRGLVKVTGKVTLEGQPVEGAGVTFWPEGGGGHAAIGRTDSGGVFHLGTFQPNDGAFRGNYKVLIQPPQLMMEPASSFAEAMANLAKVREKKRLNPDEPFGVHIAVIYGDPERTPLRQTVPPDGPVVFDVQAEASAKKPSAAPPRQTTFRDPFGPPPKKSTAKKR